MRWSVLIPNASLGNVFFLLSIAAFILGMVEPVFNPFQSTRPEGQLGSYPGTVGNVGFIFHFYGGIGYISTATLQFLSPLRRTFPKFHRVVGYLFFFFQLITLTGNLIFLFGRNPYLKGGPSSFLAATFFFNPWWVYNSVQSIRAITRGDVAQHHIYMIRTVAVSVGNFIVPPIDTIIRLILPGVHPELAYSAGFWASYIIAIILGEVCIHYVYPTPKVLPIIAKGTSGVYENLDSWTELTLILKEQYGNYFRIILEAPCNVFIPPAYHMTIRHPEKFNTFRPYTPISCNGKTIEFFIKKYEKGVMSSYLASLNVGDQVQCCGPFGSYEIQDHSQVLMIAGGTGITPMLSILRYSLETLQLQTKFHLVLYNKEWILENELAALRQQFGDQFECDFVKDSNAYNLDPVLQYHSSGKHKQHHTGSNSTVLLCGPRAFCDKMIAKAASCGIPQNEVFAFGYSDR
jgi:ferredoxin-NADP reductase